MTRSFVRALDRHGIPHTDDFTLGGNHSWPYWDRAVHWAAPQIAEVLGGSRVVRPAGGGQSRTRPRAFMARSASRLASRSAMAWRLS